MTGSLSMDNLSSMSGGLSSTAGTAPSQLAPSGGQQPQSGGVVPGNSARGLRGMKMSESFCGGFSLYSAPNNDQSSPKATTNGSNGNWRKNLSYNSCVIYLHRYQEKYGMYNHMKSLQLFPGSLIGQQNPALSASTSSSNNSSSLPLTTASNLTEKPFGLGKWKENASLLYFLAVSLTAAVEFIQATMWPNFHCRLWSEEWRMELATWPHSVWLLNVYFTNHWGLTVHKAKHTTHM